MAAEIPALIALYVALSILAFTQHAWDKRRAQKNQRRISERTLLLTCLLGGWPGAILGQTVFRHKTRKASFRRKFWTAAILNIALIALYLGFRR